MRCFRLVAILTCPAAVRILRRHYSKPPAVHVQKADSVSTADASSTDHEDFGHDV